MNRRVRKTQTIKKECIMEVLKTWKTLNENLHSMSEEDLIKLLKREKSGENRLSFLRRIQGRINKLSARRKQLEILK